MDLYCAHCDGIVNRGGACPRAERPHGCPLELTEREHYADLAEQTAPAAAPPAAQTTAAVQI